MTKYKEGADGERKGSAEAESASGPQILFEIFFSQIDSFRGFE